MSWAACDMGTDNFFKSFAKMYIANNVNMQRSENFLHTSVLTKIQCINMPIFYHNFSCGFRVMSIFTKKNSTGRNEIRKRLAIVM